MPTPPQERAFSTFDGTQLFYRAFEPENPDGRAAMLFHRGHEHGGRLLHVADALTACGWRVYAWDQRGHGRSPGARGDAPDFQSLARDAECFAKHLQTAHGVQLENTAVVAHSVGAVVAATWVHDYAPPLKAMVLAVPAFAVKLYVPLALPALRLRRKLLGDGIVKSYVKSKVLTHDKAQAAIYDADPLIFREISDRILTGLFDAGKRVVEDAGAIRVPTLVLAADKDWVVHQVPQRKFIENMTAGGTPHCRFEVLDNTHHAIFHEIQRDEIIAKVTQYLDETFNTQTPEPRELLTADQQGWTCAEYLRLAQVPNFCEKVGYGLVRTTMKTLGRASNGIKIGWETGFDSGASLDYVYENQARGCTPIGRMLDRAYLDGIGWQGIRARKTNLQRVLKDALAQVKAAGLPAHVLDLATGHGRYVLEILKEEQTAGNQVHAELRDWNQAHVASAAALAESLGVTNVTCRQADAFDPGAIAGAAPQPSIAIVSGLYELFPDNTKVLASLKALAQKLPEGGKLILTGQPYHPQMAFIARVLDNREGKPWVMRRRTSAELNTLLKEAGFTPVRMEIDAWGIFTVSLAEKQHA